MISQSYLESRPGLRLHESIIVVHQHELTTIEGFQYSQTLHNVTEAVNNRQQLTTDNLAQTCAMVLYNLPHFPVSTSCHFHHDLSVDEL